MGIFSRIMQNLFRGLTSVCAFLCVVFICGTQIANDYMLMVDGFFPDYVEYKIAEIGDENFSHRFNSDFDNTTDYVAYRKSVLEQIAAEGSVLLKNEEVNGKPVLPLESENKETKITLFGVASSSPYYGGNTASYVDPKADTVSFIGALSEYYTINTEMTKFYSGKKGATKPSMTSYNTGEVPLTAAPKDSYATYNDAAICVIGRADAEEADYSPSTNVVDTSGNSGKKGLALSANEEAMIEEAKANFDRVIIVLNTPIPVQIDKYADDPEIGAILWIGYPGGTGFNGVAKVIHGDVSPSGSLSDTFAVDASNSAAAQNFGAYKFTNYTTMLDTEFQKYGDAYLVQAEGIYTGYKYYETRYYDSVTNPIGTNAKANLGVTSGDEWDYVNEVTYSFGYGLSYTTFSEEFCDADGKTDNAGITISKDGKTATVYVKVTNTGNVSGKHAAKLFVQSPYTANNVRDGVEKSAILLMGFEKTETLAPGDSEILEINFEMKYLASYNENIVYDGLTGAYVIDTTDDYYFAIGNGAHDALNNILASQGYNAEDGMDYVNADHASKVIKSRIGEDSGDGYDYTYTISANGTRISNQFDETDYNHFKEDSVTYLTRSDWTSFPKTYTGLSLTEGMVPYLNNSRYTITEGDVSAFTWESTVTSLKVADLIGAEFDDPRWAQLISQMSLTDAISMVMKYHAWGENTAIGLSCWRVLDGPIGMYTTLGANINQTEGIYCTTEDDPKKDYSLGDFPCQPVVAATFNKELAGEQGKVFGQDSVWTGVSTQFGPGLNLHRTPYCGRNHEYYSEDSMLANYMGTAVTGQMKEYGSVAVMKHFAFNDIEADRHGIAEFMTEQQARENELRAFQGPCESNNAGGVMNSYCRLGVVSCAANDALNTALLRDEWGFTGICITDAAFKMYLPLLDWKESIAYGGSMMLATSALWKTADIVEAVSVDPYLMESVYDSVHYTLYTYANSNHMNGVMIETIRYWPELLNNVTNELGVATAGCFAAYVVFAVISKRYSFY